MPIRDTRDRQAVVSEYFERYVAQDRHLLVYALLRPIRTLTAITGLYRLPRFHPVLTDDVEGHAIRASLSHSWPRSWSPFHTATAVLCLPRDPADYTVGASKQTLRRKARSARKQGVYWGEVDDPQERIRLLALANRCERQHPLPRYREADPDNDDLLQHRLWLVAYAPGGRPLLLCVTPTSGGWALLRYFRTLGSGPAESSARYLMTQVLVERLVGRGVAYLADASSPVGLPNGLRHYQRMLGFRVARVHPSSRTSKAPRPRPVDRALSEADPEGIVNVLPLSRGKEFSVHK